MFAGIIGAALGAAGKKPKVPPAANVDVSKETATAYSDIASSLPKLQEIAASINKANTDQLLAQWRTMLPGIGQARRQAMGNTNALLRGEIPTDVMAQLERAGAAGALRSGTAGSTFGYNYTPLSIGLTSLQLQQQGLSNLQGLATTFKPQTFDYTGLFVSPMQRMAVQQWNEAQRYSNATERARIAAMPSPLQNEFMSLARNWDQLTWQAASTAAGMGMGGIGGMGGGGGGGFSSAPAWNYTAPSSAPPASFNPMYG